MGIAPMSCLSSFHFNELYIIYNIIVLFVSIDNLTKTYNTECNINITAQIDKVNNNKINALPPKVSFRFFLGLMLSNFFLMFSNFFPKF